MFVDVIDPLTGQQKAQIGLTDFGGTGNLIVAGDGYAYVPFLSVSNWDTCPGVQKNYMNLERIDTSGNASSITLGEWDTSCPASLANVPAVSIITNADQGVLVSWETQISIWTGEVFEPQSTTYYVAAVSGGSVIAQGTTEKLVQPVLQAQDGSFYGTDSDGMIKFDRSGNIQWSVPNDSPQIATADGGVIGASGITYDNNGRATGVVGDTNSAAMTSTRAATMTHGVAQATAEDASGSLGSFLSAAQSWTSYWYQTASGNVAQLSIPPILPATPPYASFYGLDQSKIWTSPLCHDDRDQFTPEYVMYGAGFVPSCQEFVNSISIPGYIYPFSTMNQDDITYNDHPNWALLASRMLNGLGYISNAYFNGPGLLKIDSGYRSPLVQAAIDKKNIQAGKYKKPSPHSQHVYGDAVDIGTFGDPGTWQALHDIARLLNPNACIEPSDPSYDHLHVDWRPWWQCSVPWQE